MVFTWIHLEDDVAPSVDTRAPTASTYSLTSPILSEVPFAMKDVSKEECETARMGMVLEEVGRPKYACSRLVLRSVDRAGLASGGSHGD